MRGGHLDIETAIKIYRRNPEIGTKEIAELFGVSPPTARRLKEEAKGQIESNAKRCYNPANINTEDAYRAWNLDINTLEKNYKRLRELGLLEEKDVTP